MSLRLALVVDRLDEARELERGRAHRAERLLVVHPHRADEADGAERPVDKAVARTDERDLGERRVGELVAEANVRLPGCARLPDRVEQVGAALDEPEQAAICVELFRPDLAEQIGGTADVQTLRSADELGERSRRLQPSVESRHPSDGSELAYHGDAAADPRATPCRRRP